MPTGGLLLVVAAAFVAGSFLYRRLYRLTGAVVYAKVRRNAIHLRRIDTGQELDLRAEREFSHERTLLGNFVNAESLLKGGLKQMKTFVRPCLLIHPLENVQGGLTQIEERAYRELAIGAGAAKAVLWVGPELSDADVLAKANA